MKINFIVPSIKTGGGYRVIQEIANKLSGDNEVIIHCSNDGTSNTFILNRKVTIKKYGPQITNKFARMFNMLYMLYKLKNEKNCFVSGTVLFPFLRIFKNVYYYMQADDYRLFDDKSLLKNNFLLWVYHTALRFAYKYTNVKIIFNSQWTYAQYTKMTEQKFQMKKILLPGINHEVFYRRKKIEKNILTIGTVKRKQAMKGFSDFLAAVGKIEKKYKIEVLIACPEKFDEIHHKHWSFINPKSDQEMGDFYRKCDIFISTSLWEGFGLTALEAMSCGVAVITSDNGGCREYTIEHNNCLMYAPGDQSELCKKIEILIKDTEKRNLIAQNGYETSQSFSWEKMAKQFIDILEKS